MAMAVSRALPGFMACGTGPVHCDVVCRWPCWQRR